VFTQEEIQDIITLVEDVIRRFKKFYSMIRESSKLEDMQSDPEWFSKEERQKYHLAQRVYASADWKDTFGSLGHVVEEFSIMSEELKKGAEGYQKLVGKELMKRRPRGFTEGTTNTSAG
jgi:hemoglobin-like flavoprotein